MKRRSQLLVHLLLQVLRSIVFELLSDGLEVLFFHF